MKKILALLLLALLAAALFTGCAGESGDSETGEDASIISLSDEESTVKGGGAAVKEGGIRISSGGSYRISGTLSEGQITVNTADSSADVIIILDGAEITNTAGPVILVEQAKNTRIRLAEGSSNVLISGTEGTALDENAPGAVIYSEDDLDIEGEGSLKLLGYINNGIGCKDDLDINGGSLNIEALNNGIRASESVDIKGGSISIKSGNDGIKTSSAQKEGKGNVKISGGELGIESSGDAISAETELNIEGGTLTVNAQGDPAQLSSKGLKAKTALSISGGEISIEAADHAIQCDAGIDISGGKIDTVSLQERGISAEGDVNISGGSINITSADDGIKTLCNINHSGGSVNIFSGSDGVQAGDKTMDSVKKLSLSGGELYISAAKYGVNADQLELKDGVLFALQNEASEGGWDYLGTQAILRDEFEAYEKAEVRADSRSMTSGNACKMIIYSAPELEAGAEYAVSNGIDEFTLTAK